MTAISVYFAARDDASGELILADASWAYVDSITVSGHCVSDPFTTQTRTFSTPVRYMIVRSYADEQGSTYLDTMEIDPGP